MRTERMGIGTTNRLSDFILEHLGPILQAWEDFTKTIEPPALTMDATDLRDHAADMLKTIAADLNTPQTAFEQAEKSKGRGKDQPGQSAAEVHADQRLAAGYTIVQLVSEYRALRASVLSLWANSSRTQLVTDPDDITRFNEAIDQALAESVSRFAKITIDQAEIQQRRLDALLQAAPVGIGMADRSGKLTMINRANQQIWGDMPLSKNVDEYVAFKGWWADGSEKHGHPLAAHEWGLARALRGEEAPRDLIEIEPFDAPSTRKTLLLRATPIRDAEAQITGAVVAQMDITGQVEAEAALRESEAKFRAITDALPQMVWSTLANGYHDYFNQRWYDFTGMPVGATDGEGWSDVLHPEDKDRTWAAWRHSLSTGAPYEVEYRLRHHSGEYRWTLGRALPVRDEQGKILRWIGTSTDIHRQKQIEVELAAVHAESERRRRLYETFLENSPDLGYVFDLNHRFTYANKVLLQMWGKSWDESIGQNCLELGYEPWHAEMHSREIEQVKATKQPIKGEVPFSGTFGRRIYEYIFVPVIGPDGEVEAIAGTTRDVTERKENEDELRDSNRRKDEFLAMLAHELRNPLAPISAAAEVLGLLTLDEERVRSTSKIIRRQVKHMTALVDDLLDVSRVTRGLVTLDKSAHDLKSVVYSAIEQVRPLIESHHHSLALNLGAEPAYVEGDQKRLVQIITNLLNNAAKYTPLGGAISLFMNVERTSIELCIQDNGVGIAPELQPRIFELFTQADRTADRSQGGLGIGLALVKSLTELQGGSVVCVSDGAGKGSRFTVTFPRLLRQDLGVSEPEKSAAIIGTSKTRRVLVVDDNIDAANMLALHLQFFGHEVRVEHSAKGALEQARIASPEVCILDIGLPDMDGNELAREFRLLKETEQALLIAVTGYGQEQDKAMSKAAGFDNHLVKPVELEKLLELLA